MVLLLHNLVMYSLDFTISFLELEGFCLHVTNSIINAFFDSLLALSESDSHLLLIFHGFHFLFFIPFASVLQVL